ncbi:MAG: hypothetical protein OER96_01350 [Gammaproteobacteria bacterium]|nr:hypothetical protein [Gammaproteobacteria bacterium]
MSLFEHINQAVNLYRCQPDDWQILMTNAMQRNFIWRHSAQAYQSLYRGTQIGPE